MFSVKPELTVYGSFDFIQQKLNLKNSNIKAA